MTIPELWSSGWTAALVNHLWQSTAVALFAWLLTLALRNNTARVRYSIWMLASVKFLVPFTLLTSVGAHWSKPAFGNYAGPAFSLMVEEFSQPFRQAPTAHGQAIAAPPAHGFPMAWALIAGVWLLGCIVVFTKWIAGWRRAARIARNAMPVNAGREFDALRRAERKAGTRHPIPLVFAQCEIEPGVFGVFRPVLLWPSGLSDRLDETQIEAIMAHEVEHVRRRDNLSVTVHALVEALFWFHPLVRWMSTKMNEERERACDEKVMEQSTRPEAYAESILKVCAFCVEPPTPCVSGVSGADLKERILRITTRRSGARLSWGRKFALSSMAVLILTAPVGFGVLHGQSGSLSGENSPEASASTAGLPRYEVATIKPSTSGDERRMMRMTPDGTSIHGVPVQMLLQQAFGVESDRILGAPAWVKSNRYDIEAKVAPDDAPKMEKLKMEQRRAMLLPLMEERLNLKYHHETRELPMYALIVAKGGPKLTESRSGDPMPNGNAAISGSPPKDATGNQSTISMSPGRVEAARGQMRMGPGRIEAHSVGMIFLAHALSAMEQRTVVDKTGLTGSYDLTLQWTPDEAMMPMASGGGEGGSPKGDMPAEAGGPSLLTALQEQLGLKLESQKGMVDVIVIDHIDLPTQN